MPDVELYTFNCADWPFEKSFMVQTQDVGEAYPAKIPFYLIDHPEGNVLFDTGIRYRMKKDPLDYGTHGAPHMEAFVDDIEMTEDDKPVNQLEDLGYSTDEIDYVVLSHLHVDHAGNVKDFSDSEILVHKDELSYAWWPDPVQKLFYLEGDFHALRSNEFDVTRTHDKHDVFGDGKVVTFHTPGHTPGHQSLKVELENTGTVILTADVTHLRQGYEMGFMPSFNWSLEKSIESLERVKHLAKRKDAMVSIFHDVDDWEKMPDPPESLD